MRFLKKLLFFIFFLHILVYPVSAGLTDSASAAISDGIVSFIISLSDTIFSISFSGYTEPVGETGAVAYIYNVASWTPNPEDFSVTNQFRKWSEAIFAKGYEMILLCALIALLVTYYKTDVAEKIEEITGIKIGSRGNILMKKAFDGMAIAIFMYIGIYFTLLLNDILTKAVLLESLDSIAPTPDNFVLYLLMAFSYLLLGLFFGARILIIFLFYSFALIVGLCLLIDPTKKVAMNTCAYFVQTVFFQFIIVLYFTASILIIKSLTLPSEAMNGLMYFIMMIGGLILAIKMMLGTGVIRWAGKLVALAAV